MEAPTFTSWTLRSLHNHLLDRRFAIPKLQRNFVWDARRAAKLLDSVYKEMPIGSLFLWEMDRKSANLIRQSADVLPSFNGKHKSIWFVIDGQQRLSVMHQAFEAQNRTNDAGREIDFSRLCFVVDPDRDDENSARIVYRKPLDQEIVPIRDILASDWKKRMPSHAQSFLRKIANCRARLLSYPIPVVTVHSATLAEIGEVFIRINSQGMRITSADRAIALMGKLDVRAMAEELRQKIRDEVFALSTIDPILMGFNLISESPSVNGDPPKLDAMAKRWSKRIGKDDVERDRFRRQWDRYQKAFRSSVDYLHHRFPVHDESYLPSANMLATLAVFYYHHPGQPTKQQMAELKKWFWTTGIAQRYSGRGYHRNISADAKLFEDMARGINKRFTFRDRLDPILDIQSTEYSARSARTRTFLCLLASQKPCYLENGEPIALDSVATSPSNQRHRHHIFPQARLRRYFSPRIYNSLCNVCFLVSRDNQKIGMRLPRKYLAEYRDTGRRQFRQVMKSHLIPIAPTSGVWESGLVGAFKLFRRERLALICKELEKAAGIKLFRTT